MKTEWFLWIICSVWVMMNKQTRRLSKIPDAVRAEIEPYFMDSAPIVDEDGRKLPKLYDSTADYIRTGLTVSQMLLNYEGYWHVLCVVVFFLLLIFGFSFWYYIFNLQPRWSDLDVNQHVNNVKYIGWILEVGFVAKQIIFIYKC